MIIAKFSRWIRRIVRYPAAKLYLLVSVVAFLNFILFAMFVPLRWEPQHEKNTVIRLHRRGINKSVVPDAVTVYYKSGSHQFDFDSKSTREKCPENPELLVGNLTLNFSAAEDIYWESSDAKAPLKTNFSSMFMSSSTSFGKHSMINGTDVYSTYIFEPSHCKPVRTVAIIIPFRDREPHLRVILGHLLPILQRQLIRYSVFVISQIGEDRFNKGRLMNTGFEFAVETGKRSGIPFDCYVFQDVDLLVERDTLLYRCSEGHVVDHFSISINKFNYIPVCCGMTVGGVLAFKEKQYRAVNGYPIHYWGWGVEDDDMYKRILSCSLEIVRPIPQKGRFSMIKHKADNLNPRRHYWNRYILFAVTRYFDMDRYKSDGLTNLDTKIVNVEHYPLFTFVSVDVGKPTILQRLIT